MATFYITKETANDFAGTDKFNGELDAAIQQAKQWLASNKGGNVGIEDDKGNMVATVRADGSVRKMSSHSRLSAICDRELARVGLAGGEWKEGVSDFGKKTWTNGTYSIKQNPSRSGIASTFEVFDGDKPIGRTNTLGQAKALAHS